MKKPGSALPDGAGAALALKLAKSLGDFLLRGAVHVGADKLVGQVTGESKLLEHIAQRVYESQYPSKEWAKLPGTERDTYFRIARAALLALTEMTAPRLGSLGL